MQQTLVTALVQLPGGIEIGWLFASFPKSNSVVQNWVSARVVGLGNGWGIGPLGRYMGQGIGGTVGLGVGVGVRVGVGKGIRASIRMGVGSGIATAFTCMLRSEHRERTAAANRSLMVI